MKPKLSKTLVEDGFSLVELMIVVGIIGLLATIGVPKYRGFVAKSRQLEAKKMLYFIDSLETAYFNEHADYSSNVQEIGYTEYGKYYQLAKLVVPSKGEYAVGLVLKPNTQLCPGVTIDGWALYRTSSSRLPQGVPVELANADGNNPIQKRCN